MFKKITTNLLLALFVFNFASATQAFSKDMKVEAQKFIDEYSATWTKLRYESSEAEWKSNTMIVEGDDTNSKATVAAAEKLVAFTGSKANSDAASKFLKKKNKLTRFRSNSLK